MNRATPIERVKAALLLATMPLWFLPMCLFAGILFYGRDELRCVPSAWRLIMRGTRP